MTEKRAVIVGAGIAGLAAAWQLDRIGWKSVVVERSPMLREGGYMLGLSGPGYQTAKRMGLLPALEAVSYRIDENVYRDRDGRELMRLRYREFLKDLPYLALRRGDLVAGLLAALPAGHDIRLGVTIETLESTAEGVSVTLSDGSSLEADLLIGADGFRSSLRERLFGARPEQLVPLGYRFAVYDIDDTLDLGSDFLSYAEPGHMAEYYALKGGRLAALHIWRDEDGGPPGSGWDVLDHVARRSHPAVRQFLEIARRGAPPLLDSLTMVDLPAWSQGRALLLGDAAHCLTLVSGQGAGISIASAEILAQELARAPVEAALAAHERRLRPAIVRLQQRSRRMAAVFIPATPVSFHLRNLMLRWMPRSWLGRYFTNAVKSEITLAGKDV